MRACGPGYTVLKKFASLMNIPKAMIGKNYNKIIGRLINVRKAVAEKIMQDACNELRGDDDGIIDATVSCDESWQRQGVLTTISMTNGKMSDIESIWRVCKCFY